MFIVLYSFISTDWRKTAYWMILRTRFCTSGLSKLSVRESVRSSQLSCTIQQDKCCFQTHWGPYMCWGELGCNARRPCGCPWAWGLSGSRYSKSFHRDTVKTMQLLPFHSSTHKIPHIKPVYLGWFLADILLVVFCSASPRCGGQ